MFGLENKQRPQGEFLFELEKELKDPAKRKEIQERLEKRLQMIRENLRTGDSQEAVARLGTIFQGYAALVTVIARTLASKK